MFSIKKTYFIDIRTLGRGILFKCFILRVSVLSRMFYMTIIVVINQCNPRRRWRKWLVWWICLWKMPRRRWRKWMVWRRCSRSEWYVWHVICRISDSEIIVHSFILIVAFVSSQPSHWNCWPSIPVRFESSSFREERPHHLHHLILGLELNLRLPNFQIGQEKLHFIFQF